MRLGEFRIERAALDEDPLLEQVRASAVQEELRHQVNVRRWKADRRELQELQLAAGKRRRK